MAQKIVTVCDLDGCGREDAVSTSLSFNSESVEIDLCPEHIEAVHNALFGLLQAGRTIKRRGRPPKAAAAATRSRSRSGTRIPDTTVPKRIDHSSHDHPQTKAASTACRAAMPKEAGVR